MLKVLTKTACYIEGVWHAANTEIHILAQHFHDDVHVLIEDLRLDEPEPTAVPPPAEPTAVPASKETSI